MLMTTTQQMSKYFTSNTKKDKKIHLISGLPRSGSTLLCNLLNMNPKFHDTPTSPVIDTLKSMRSTFSHNATFKTQNRLDLMEPMRRGMKGFIEGFYEDKDIVFDKCRGWTSNISLLDEILGNTDTKIIWTYRDPVEVVSSVEKRYQDTILLENVDESSGMDFTTLDSTVTSVFGSFWKKKDSGLPYFRNPIHRPEIKMTKTMTRKVRVLISFSSL